MAPAKARQPRAFSRVSISLIPSLPTGPRYWAGASPYCAQARSEQEGACEGSTKAARFRSRATELNSPVVCQEWVAAKSAFLLSVRR